MEQRTHIEKIINDITELKDLLQVISQCNGNIPSILYKLAQEKAQIITQSISQLSGDQPETAAGTTEIHPIETAEQHDDVPAPEPNTMEPAAQPIMQKPVPMEEEPETTDNQPIPMKETKEESAWQETVEPAPVSQEEAPLPEKKEVEQVSSPAQPSVHSTATDNCIGGQTTARLLDDILKQRIASKDIRKAISLNDRFRFRRDLFGGDDETMNKTIDILNQLHSAEEALNYLEQHFQWDYEKETTNDFITILEKRFSL